MVQRPVSQVRAAEATLATGAKSNVSLAYKIALAEDAVRGYRSP